MTEAEEAAREALVRAALDMYDGGAHAQMNRNDYTVTAAQWTRLHEAQGRYRAAIAPKPRYYADHYMTPDGVRHAVFERGPNGGRVLDLQCSYNVQGQAERIATALNAAEEREK